MIWSLTIQQMGIIKKEKKRKYVGTVGGGHSAEINAVKGARSRKSMKLGSSRWHFMRAKSDGFTCVMILYVHMDKGNAAMSTRTCMPAD